MIQDNDRPKTNPQDPSELRLYEEGQDLLQGVNGAVQPALEAMGYAHLRSGDFVTQTGVQDREFKADGKTYVSVLLCLVFSTQNILVFICASPYLGDLC